MSWTSAAPIPARVADAPPPAIAGHAVTVDGVPAGGMMSLRIGLRGEPLVALARALVELDGVRVTAGPESSGRGCCYTVSCLGFKMVLSSPPVEDRGDVALALVSREPRPPLALLSELATLLDRLMSAPPPPAPRPFRDRAGTTKDGDEEMTDAGVQTSASSLRRSTLRPGKPLTRRTALKRKTPLARGPFRRQ